MAKRKTTVQEPEVAVEVKVPEVQDVVKNICRGDIISYINNNPDCGYDVFQLSSLFQSQGYKILNI